MAPHDIATLAQDRWFGALPPERQAAIRAHLRIRSVAQGTRLYRLGDPPDGLHVVIDGQVQLVNYPAAGTEMVMMIVRPGRWFGELSVLDGGPRPHDAVIAEPSRVAHVPMRAIGTLAQAAPSWWRELALLTCMHQRMGLRNAAQTRAQPALVRLARLLAGPGDPTVCITQDALARTIGVSRQHINRMLADLADRGLLHPAYRAIAIIDRDGLRRLAEQEA
jgi:CRP/FNR family transcriptional regulator, cyclic AMP receptor protein